uniref:RxLR effector protein n=1 Tax=Peronospora matthiolae TaxID=2874970 RepID=A0AAV1URD0_9STRA
MRLAYTAVTTLAALLYCSDSVPAAGDPKAVLKHDVSQFVARRTYGDDYRVNTKRLLRNAHAQGDSDDLLVTEERGLPSSIFGVTSGIPQKFASTKNVVADGVKTAAKKMEDKMTELIMKLDPYGKKLMKNSKFKAFMKHYNTLFRRKSTVKDAKKPTTTTGNTNTVKDKGEATENGGAHITHDTKPETNVGHTTRDDMPPVTTISHSETVGQPKVNHNDLVPPKKENKPKESPKDTKKDDEDEFFDAVSHL